MKPLAYGPTANGSLLSFADRMNAETLSGQNKPPESTWEEFTVKTLNAASVSGRSVLFDLTYVQDLSELLQGRGRYASTITAVELRHIYRHWNIFNQTVRFYNNGTEQEAPWEKTSF